MSIILNWAKVRDIRQRCAQGESQVSLCKEFGISVVQMSRIINNLSWRQETIPIDEMSLEERYKDTCRKYKQSMGEDYPGSIEEWIETEKKILAYDASLIAKSLEPDPQAEATNLEILKRYGMV